MKPQEQWVLINVKPIVPEELWDQCNFLLEDRRKKGARPARKVVHLFTGFTFCVCGQKMYVPSNTPKYVCYECRNKIPVDDLEGIFHEQLKEFFFSPDDVARYLAQGDQVVKEKTELVRVLETERDAARAEMEKTYRLYIADQLTPEGFGSRNRPLDQRVKQIDEELPRLQGEIDYLKIQYLASSEIVSEAQNLYSRWTGLVFDEKRKIVENIVERIAIGKDEISINLSYLPSFSEIAAGKQRINTDSSRR